MRITFCGAAGEVTGSAYLVQTTGATVLVDCGLFQGGEGTEVKNKSIAPIDPQSLDAVVVTHAHLDHTGRLPILTARGLKCNVFCTPATEDFAQLVLLDSANLQEADAERKNRKLWKPGMPKFEPLYTRGHVERLNPLTWTIPLGKTETIADGIAVRFYEAGHILGSASVEMSVTENGRTKIIVFSGDLGPRDSPILNDYHPPPRADLVIEESTYGDRDHRPLAETIVEFRGILREAVSNRKKILIPAFAIGRSQQIIYHIAEAVKDGVIEPIPIFIDSPMASEATRLYGKHRDLFDAEARAHESTKDLHATLDRITFVRTADESKALNDRGGPMVVIAGSGMCDGGRIVHHLKNNLDRDTAAVVIVGYQSEGSLGRRLVNGQKEVKIFGERIPVRAKIHTLGGFSGHAGQSDLLDWAHHLAGPNVRWVLTHGEARAREPFRQALKQRFQIDAQCPMLHDVIEI